MSGRKIKICMLEMFIEHKCVGFFFFLIRKLWFNSSPNSSTGPFHFHKVSSQRLPLFK